MNFNDIYLKTYTSLIFWNGETNVSDKCILSSIVL